MKLCCCQSSVTDSGRGGRTGLLGCWKLAGLCMTLWRLTQAELDSCTKDGELLAACLRAGPLDKLLCSSWAGCWSPTLRAPLAPNPAPNTPTPRRAGARHPFGLEGWRFAFLAVAATSWLIGALTWALAVDPRYTADERYRCGTAFPTQPNWSLD